MIVKINFKNLDIEDVTLSSVCAIEQRWKDGSEFSYLKNSRPNSGLMLVECKNVRFRCSNGPEFDAPCRSIVYLPAGCNYLASFSNPDEVYPGTWLVNFNLKNNENTDVLFSEHPYVICKDYSNMYESSFRKIWEAYMNNSLLGCMGELCLLFESLINGFRSESGEEADIFTPYIRQRLGEDLSIEMLTHKFAMSESTLRRKFKSLFGLSPLRYINELKFEGAKKLLAIPEVSTEEICQRLGFYDTAHFTKSFKGRFGITPIQYRKAYYAESFPDFSN